MSWSRVKLSEILTERQEIPDPQNIASGKQPIIAKIRFSDGKILLRTDGKTKTKMISIYPGDLVLSGINAMKGAIALYESSSNQKLAATIHYSSYEINKAIVIPQFLWLLLRNESFHKILDRQVPQGIKTELKANRLLPVEIPIPGLKEQVRILTLLRRTSALIKEVRRLREDTMKLHDQLYKNTVDQAFIGFKIDSTLESVLLGRPRNGWSPKCDDNGTTAVLSLSAVTGFRYIENAFKTTSLPTKKDAHYWLSPGDVLLTRSNTLELVGHAAIYNGNPYPCIYPDLMMRLPLDDKKVDRKFLILWLQSTAVRTYIKKNAKGTSPTMKKINQGTVLNIPFPTSIDLEKQKQLTAKLLRFQCASDNLRVIQNTTNAPIDTLFERVISETFKGHLNNV